MYISDLERNHLCVMKMVIIMVLRKASLLNMIILKT